MVYLVWQPVAGLVYINDDDDDDDDV